MSPVKFHLMSAALCGVSILAGTARDGSLLAGVLAICAAGCSLMAAMRTWKTKQ